MTVEIKPIFSLLLISLIMASAFLSETLQPRSRRSRLAATSIANSPHENDQHRNSPRDAVNQQPSPRDPASGQDVPAEPQLDRLVSVFTNKRRNSNLEDAQAAPDADQQDEPAQPVVRKGLADERSRCSSNDHLAL
jgi:hypothetical protein